MFYNKHLPKGEQIMKEIYMEKEDAVSPVIATILMVAITVVLAATVYILVSHYTSVGAATPFTASIAVANEGQSGKIYYYNLTFTLSTPASITTPSNLHVIVSGNIAAGWDSSVSVLTATSASSLLSSSGSTGVAYAVFNPDGSFVPLSSSSIQSGATIVLMSNSDLSGSTVSITYSGYSGTVSTTLP